MGKQRADTRPTSWEINTDWCSAEENFLSTGNGSLKSVKIWKGQGITAQFSWTVPSFLKTKHSLDRTAELRGE